MADDRVRLRMYRGFREVLDGFTKNIAYVFEGGMGAVPRGVDLLHVARLDRCRPAVLARGRCSASPCRRGDVTPRGDRASLLTVVARVALGCLLELPAVDGGDAAAHGGRLGGDHGALASPGVSSAGEVRWRGRTYDAARARF